MSRGGMCGINDNPHYWQTFTQKYPYWRGHRVGQHYDQNFYNRTIAARGKVGSKDSMVSVRLRLLVTACVALELLAPASVAL